MALQELLVSPAFLFRIEHDPESPPNNPAYRIGDVDLASRLSFFSLEAAFLIISFSNWQSTASSRIVKCSNSR